jgi:hypothetical protein
MEYQRKGYGAAAGDAEICGSWYGWVGSSGSPAVRLVLAVCVACAPWVWVRSWCNDSEGTEDFVQMICLQRWGRGLAEAQWRRSDSRLRQDDW